MDIKKRNLIILAAMIALNGCGDKNDKTAHAAVEDSKISANDAASDHSRQDAVDLIARSIQIKYRVIADKNGAPCSLPNGAGTYSDGACYEGRIYLTAQSDIPDAGWEIYFSQTEPLYSFHSDEFEVTHLNGDLHRLRPTAGYKGFQSGSTKVIDIIARGQVLTEAKLLPNYYVTAIGASAKLIDSTKIQIDETTGLHTRPYIFELNDINKQFKSSPTDETPLATSSFLFGANQDVAPASRDVIDAAIIPTPVNVRLDDAGAKLDLSKGVFVKLNGLDRKKIAAPLSRLALFNVTETKGGIPLEISVQSNPSEPSGAYTLDIRPDRIKIVGVDSAGAAYGLYSIAALITPGRTDIPTMLVRDAPRFPFRGMHVDVARNFHSKQEILKLLDQMAAYKLNKLHLHLADDEGWRIEISGLPELTQIGSRRCHDPEENTCLMPQLGSGPYGDSSVDGYYSIADYTEILKAASARHIQVIPSIDMPGHSRAAVKSMEARYRRLMVENRENEAKQYLLTDLNDTTKYESIQFYRDNTMNPCVDSSYAFVSKVFDELRKIHKTAGQPLTRFHLGADETVGAWNESPACNALISAKANDIDSIDRIGSYFVERVSKIIADKGMEPAAWSDGLEHVNIKNMPPRIQSNVWGTLSGGGHITANKHANQGWEVVISTPDALYFDFPYEADPKEGGFYWAARRVNTRKVFEFMPENLPVHAEFWKNSSEHPFEINDTVQVDDNNNVISRPLDKAQRFIGMQGHIWSETVATDDRLEYQVFPRIIALAERAWHRADWEVPYNHDGAVFNQNTRYFTDERRAARDSDWARFASVLGGKELAKLDSADIAYRIPTVGARITEGKLEANLIFPGMRIEYRAGDGPWLPYASPIEVDGPVEVRALGADGGRPGRVLPVK